ncbi:MULTISPECIES: hypothetical protein [unclassified Ruegeria]|uniref:hypothetical protein n=1 Tax=unclassified Ruegeria TaxID=2625375 RepID=UPI0014889433|nr:MULTISPECIES: hypothetical protein [unclassified Ruegeria]NOE36105.1 hypothetical protein [Ruegeria sp. HKCCD7318]
MHKKHNFIDMHTHLFTARYLPLHSIFHSFGIPYFLAGGMTILAVSVTRISDFEQSPESEPDQNDLINALLDRDVDQIMWAIAYPIRMKIREYQKIEKPDYRDWKEIEHLLRALDDIDHDIGFSEQNNAPISVQIINGEALSKKSVFGDDATMPDLLDQFLAAAFDVAGQHAADSEFFHEAEHLHVDEPYKSDSDAGFRAIGIPGEQIGNIFQLLEFIAIMTLSERNRYKALKEDFKKDGVKDDLQARLYVGILVDMRRAFDKLQEWWMPGFLPPHFDFTEQMERMQSLARENVNELITFGAVDPFRGRNWKQIVDSGVRMGINGYKIYPPLGIRPIDVHGNPTPVARGRKFSEYRKKAKNPAPYPIVQTAMEEIIRHFSRNNLRMFAHCNPMGFQVETGYGVYSDPEIWRRAMEDYNAQGLWLFLAHGGGATEIDWMGWAAEDNVFDRTFAFRAIKLVEDYDNVYLGLGHILGILDARYQRKIFRRIKSTLKAKKPAGAKHHFGKKVCFGTDWAMPMMVGRTREYLNAFYKLFDDPDISCYADDFFEGNAKRFLDIK